MAKVFTVRRVEELVPRMIEITNELIDRVQHQGRIDFIHNFAIPLPVIVIAEILGIPVERRIVFLHCCIAGQTNQTLTNEQQAQLEKFISHR